MYNTMNKKDFNFNHLLLLLLFNNFEFKLYLKIR